MWGALLVRTSVAHARLAGEWQGETEWRLQVDGDIVATGGILFHDNAPYGDISMDVAEPFRRLGAYRAQELKRVAYELGSIPCARCGRDNVRRARLQKAGFVPFAHILNGSIPSV